MLNVRHRGDKPMNVKMDDKGSWQFWLDFFFIKTESVVADVTDFPEARNRVRKCFYSLMFLYMIMRA